jgi:hypothetical protein
MVTAGRMAAGQVLCLHYRTTSPRNPRHWHWVRIHPGTPAARSFVHSIHFRLYLLIIGYWLYTLMGTFFIVTRVLNYSREFPAEIFQYQKWPDNHDPPCGEVLFVLIIRKLSLGSKVSSCCYYCLIGHVHAVLYKGPLQHWWGFKFTLKRNSSYFSTSKRTLTTSKILGVWILIMIKYAIRHENNLIFRL